MFVGDQRDDCAGLAGAARATRTVEVVGCIGRRIEVHDAGQVLDVDATGCDVCGHQGVGAPVGESRKGALTLGLCTVAVDGHRGDPRLAELPGDPIGPASCAAEDNRRPCWLTRRAVNRISSERSARQKRWATAPTLDLSATTSRRTGSCWYLLMMASTS